VIKLNMIVLDHYHHVFAYWASHKKVSEEYYSSLMEGRQPVK